MYSKRPYIKTKVYVVKTASIGGKQHKLGIFLQEDSFHERLIILHLPHSVYSENRISQRGSAKYHIIIITIRHPEKPNETAV